MHSAFVFVRERHTRRIAVGNAASLRVPNQFPGWLQRTLSICIVLSTVKYRRTRHSAADLTQFSEYFHWILECEHSHWTDLWSEQLAAYALSILPLNNCFQVQLIFISMALIDLYELIHNYYTVFIPFKVNKPSRLRPSDHFVKCVWLVQAIFRFHY